jgi:hypothetical protein
MLLISKKVNKGTILSVAMETCLVTLDLETAMKIEVRTRRGFIIEGEMAAWKYDNGSYRQVGRP